MTLDPTKERIPIRIQRQRTKGWKKPYATVNCGRPGIYGNPFVVGQPGVKDAKEAVELYERWLSESPTGRNILEHAKINLRGRNLMCWCRVGDFCHADVLLKLVNS